MVKEEPSIQQNADNKQDKPEKSKNVILNIFETIAGVFAPMLPAITAAGMLKGLLALFVSLEWMSLEQTHIVSFPRLVTVCSITCRC